MAGTRYGGAGESAGRMGAGIRAAERLRQHQRARVVLPIVVAAAVVAGWALAALAGWPVGLVVALVLVVLGLRRLYRQGDESRRWAVGAAGEVRTARLLAPLARRGHVVLHDRAIPGKKANLDHLVIGPAGALYVDTKHWASKRSRITVRGGALWYGRYDQTRALQTVVWEAERAARALGVPVRPVVAVHGNRVPAPRGRMEIAGVTVVDARRLRGLLRSLPPAPGWDPGRVAEVGRLAEQRLPPR